MAKDEPTKPSVDTGAPDTPTTDEADAEGHSMGLLLGVNAMSQSRDSDPRSRARKPAEEQLPPLSKPWPNMRDDKKA